MEIEENIKGGEAQPSPKENISPENKQKDIGVILLNVLLALVTIFLLGYIAYKNGYIDLENILNNKEEQDQDVTNSSDSSIFENYYGEILSAIHPDGWVVEEYFDGEGTDMVTEDMQYTGLTGIKILNGEKEIIHIQAVYGIGIEGCPQLPRFSDSSSSYEAEQEEIISLLDEDITYLDYTETPFSEFEWLGKTFRRVETTLYYDTVESNEFFEPQCETNFFTLEDFGFEDSDGYGGNTYMYTISEDATEEELDMLDQILASITSN